MPLTWAISGVRPVTCEARVMRCESLVVTPSLTPLGKLWQVESWLWELFSCGQNSQESRRYSLNCVTVCESTSTVKSNKPSSAWVVVEHLYNDLTN